MKKHQFGEEKL